MESEKITTVQIQGISAETLFKRFDDLQSQINNLQEKPKTKEVYLTRLEVSKLLKVSLVTIHNWSNEAILKPHKIGNKVLYKENEVIEALQHIKPRV